MSLIDAMRRARAPFARQRERARMPRVDPKNARILLVYLFDGLGDAWLLGPVLAALADAGVRGPIGVVAPPTAVRALRLFDLPLRLYSSDDPELEAKLGRHRYDIAVDLSLREGRDGRPALLASGARTCLGWRTDAEPANVPPLTYGVPDRRWQADRHWSRYMILPLAPLGIGAPQYDVPLRTSAASYAKAHALIAARPHVALIPGGRNPSKLWGPHHFARVGRMVVERFSGFITVIGAPAEKSLVREIAEAIGPGARAFTQKNLSVLKELLAAADAIVTNDTGPMHLAYLLERPTVAVFTWMSPVCWGPWKTDPNFVVLRAPAGEDPAHLGQVWAQAIEGHLVRLFETSSVT